MAKGVMTRQRVYAPRCPMAMQSGATLAHAYLKAAHHDAAAGIWAADEAHLRSRCGAYVEQPVP